MGLTDFFKRLFTQPKTAKDYLADWENERKERIKNYEVQLKEWILKLLKEKGQLAFTWESGNDEGFITFKDFNEAEENNFMHLEGFIVDAIDIPSAGEFQMNGEGDIYIDNGLVKVKHKSVTKLLIDYDEENEKEIYDAGESESGDLTLFAI